MTLSFNTQFPQLSKVSGVYFRKISHTHTHTGFPGGSAVKNLPAMQETQVGSLSQKEPLEEEMAIRSNTLAWEIPWIEEPGWLYSIGSQRVGQE